MAMALPPTATNTYNVSVVRCAQQQSLSQVETKYTLCYARQMENQELPKQDTGAKLHEQ